MIKKSFIVLFSVLIITNSHGQELKNRIQALKKEAIGSIDSEYQIHYCANVVTPVNGSSDEYNSTKYQGIYYFNTLSPYLDELKNTAKQEIISYHSLPYKWMVQEVQIGFMQNDGASKEFFVGEDWDALFSAWHTKYFSNTKNYFKGEHINKYPLYPLQFLFLCLHLEAETPSCSSLNN